MKRSLIKNSIKLFIIILLLITNILASISNNNYANSYKKKRFFSSLKTYRTIKSKEEFDSKIYHRSENSFKRYRINNENENEKEENRFFKFLVGFGMGFGLKVDASEELKNCFFADKKKNTNSIKDFIASTENTELKKISEKKIEQKQSASSFTKLALELLGKFKKCKPFKETFLSFVKNKIINLGIKGIAYILAGPLGLILKGTYDIYKIITEINNFYKIRKIVPVDHFKLGSAVGKIIYYTQNILFKRKMRLL